MNCLLQMLLFLILSSLTVESKAAESEAVEPKAIESENKEEPQFKDIHRSVWTNDIATVDAYLKTGGDPNIRDKYGGALLHQAYTREMANLLVQADANLNARDNRGRTPLHTYSFYERMEVADVVIQAGADVYAKDKNSVTPARVSVQGNKKKFLIFLAQSEKVNLSSKKNKNDQGETLLFTAKNMEIADILLKAGVDLYAKGDDGRNVLHINSRFGKFDLVEFYLQSADKKKLKGFVNTKDDRDRTPLHGASFSDQSKVAGLLLDFGAKVDARDDLDRTPLLIAAFSAKEAKIAPLLIAAGADVNARDEGNRTPLSQAVFTENLAIIPHLLAANADMNAKNKIGQTPLDNAKDKPKVLALLVKLETDPDNKNKVSEKLTSSFGKVNEIQLVSVDPFFHCD